MCMFTVDMFQIVPICSNIFPWRWVSLMLFDPKSTYLCHLGQELRTLRPLPRENSWGS